MRLTCGSLFAGIGGFDLGFERAGFEIRWQVEIDADCVAVLMNRWGTVRRYRDLNALVYGKHRSRVTHGLVLPSVDCVVGGFPCQDLSVAGKRAGLTGSRSGLFFAFMRALRLMQPKPSVVVIENVPGLFSSNRGRDFHTVLSTLAECGFRRAYRVLDSQYFGVPQRRRRVFIVGCFRASGLNPAAALFESGSGRRHSSPRRATRPRVAATLRGRSHRAGVNAPGRGGEDDVNLITGPLGGGDNGSGRRSEDDPNLVWALGSHAGCADGVQTNQSHAAGGPVGLGVQLDLSYSLRAGRPSRIATSTGERERALVGSMYKRHDDDTDTLIAFDPTQITSRLNRSAPKAGDPCHPLSSSAHPPAIAATLNSGGNAGGFRTEPGAHLVAAAVTASAGHHGHSSPRGDGSDNLTVAYTLPSVHRGVGNGHNTTFPNGVRRLTPLECERLQGFPDGWTCLCGNGHRGSAYCTCPDTPRYKALGNAVTVPVAEWIARRILAAEGLT